MPATRYSRTMGLYQYVRTAGLVSPPQRTMVLKFAAGTHPLVLTVHAHVPCPRREWEPRAWHMHLNGEPGRILSASAALTRTARGTGYAFTPALESGQVGPVEDSFESVKNETIHLYGRDVPLQEGVSRRLSNAAHKDRATVLEQFREFQPSLLAASGSGASLSSTRLKPDTDCSHI